MSPQVLCPTPSELAPVAWKLLISRDVVYLPLCSYHIDFTPVGCVPLQAEEGDLIL
jgi:hypothetical protein